tara:strand:+ start:321 stop:1484 length:1164 start_codon:yes stop_codon:yes gene_type:complete
MKYLGKDLREGMRLVASSNITSNTATVSLTNIFKPERLYYINVMDFRPNNNQRSLQYRWLDSGGSAISITNYHEGGKYGASGGSGSGSGVYSANRTAYVNTVGGVGNASDEHGMFELWCVPNTANEKMALGSGAFHSGTDEDYSSRFIMASRLNTSATRSEGIQWVVDSNTGGHQINNVTIRVYEIDAQLNKTPNIHQKRHGVNWVQSKYLGETPKGQGWAKIKELTASDGDSALDFEDVFTSNYLRYYIVGTDCRPATDNKNLLFQYRDASGLNTGTYVSSFFSADANGGSGSGHADDQTVGLVLNNIGNTGNEVGHFTAFLDPVTTNTPKIMMYKSISQMADTTTRYITGNVNYNDGTVMTGIKWYWSSGNWESGKITIYGVEHK